MNAKKCKKNKIEFQKIKEIIIIIIIVIIIIIITIKKTINKIAHSCNLLRFSFFKWCVKENVVPAVFMFELTLFQIFGPRNDTLFCPLIVLQRKRDIQCHLRRSVRVI